MTIDFIAAMENAKVSAIEILPRRHHRSAGASPASPAAAPGCRRPSPGPRAARAISPATRLPLGQRDRHLHQADHDRPDGDRVQRHDGACRGHLVLPGDRGRPVRQRVGPVGDDGRHAAGRHDRPGGGERRGRQRHRCGHRAHLGRQRRRRPRRLRRSTAPATATAPSPASRRRCSPAPPTPTRRRPRAQPARTWSRRWTAPATSRPVVLGRHLDPARRHAPGRRHRRHRGRRDRRGSPSAGPPARRPTCPATTSTARRARPGPPPRSTPRR